MSFDRFGFGLSVANATEINASIDLADYIDASRELRVEETGVSLALFLGYVQFVWYGMVPYLHRRAENFTKVSTPTTGRREMEIEKPYSSEE